MKKLLFFVAATAATWANAIDVTSSVKIGAEAEVTLPQTALWEKVVNLRPGNGEMVTLNPPQFSWPYYYPMTNWADQSQKQFCFQASYDPSFSSLIFDIATPSAMYNRLAPFTNSPVYWRVAYIEQGQTNLWITNSFTISSAAKTWDRSMLADPNYLAAKLQHPYMLFNAGNRAAMFQFFLTNTATKGQCLYGGIGSTAPGYTGTMMQNMITTANQVVASSWWPNSIPAFTNVTEATWASDIATVAFVWQMTQSPTYLAANPQQQLVLCASNFVAEFAPNQDYIYTQAYITESMALALGYDWLYEVMTPAQRQAVVQALDLRCKNMIDGGTFYTPQVDAWGEYAPTNYVYPLPLIAQNNAGSQFEGGTSHEIDNFHFSMPMALAGWQDSTNCALLGQLGLDFMMNTVINSGACHSDDGQDEGRVYGMTHLFGGNGALACVMLAQTVFPEAQFNQNPFWSNTIDFWDRYEPVGFIEGHDPWGDMTGFGPINDWVTHTFGRSLAAFTGNGVAQQHYYAEIAATSHGDSSLDNYASLPFFYDFPSPTQAIDPDATGRLYTNAGWMISSTYGPNTANCFNNGVGIIFQARPQGSDEGHCNFSDLSYQLWAYGAVLTDAGSGMAPFNKVSWCHYSPLVNGLGQCQAQGVPLVPYYSKFIGFQDTSNYTYVAADATAAYPHANFTPGGWLIPNQYAAQESGAPLAFVQKVQRHILFARRKYFVMYDDFQSLKPATFTWLYPILPNTLQLNTNGGNVSFTYTCSNAMGGQVLVQVAHIAYPQALTLLDETGTNEASNPITGENYWNQGGSLTPRAHALWVNNATPETNFHFLTVIYPVPPGGQPAQITRLDDYTVAVTNGAEGDVITFNPNTQTPATTIIDEPTISAAGACDDVVFTTNIVSPTVTSRSSGGGGSSSGGAPTGLPAPSKLHVVMQEVPYFTPTVTNGLVGWWRLDEGSGTDAADTSGLQNKGELINSPGWVPGEVGDGVSLDGATQYIATSDVVNTPTVTISAWINIPTNPTNSEAVVGFCDGFDASTEDKVLFLQPGGKPYFYVYCHGSGAPTTSAPPAPITPGVWTFVVGEYDGTNVTTYINGAAAGSASGGGSSYTSYTHPNIFIGAPIHGSNYGYFNGSIDDVRVYNRALSPAEIAAVYNWRGP